MKPFGDKGVLTGGFGCTHSRAWAEFNLTFRMFFGREQFPWRAFNLVTFGDTLHIPWEDYLYSNPIIAVGRLFADNEN